MKYNKIFAALAAVVVSSSSVAAVGTVAGAGPLAGLNTNEAAAGSTTVNGVAAVAVVTDCKTRNALQVMQAMPSGCIGNNTKLCAPNISSAELRSLITGSVTAAGSISDAGGTLAGSLAAGSAAASAACEAANPTNPAIQAFRVTDGTLDAITEFTGGGSVGGLAVGAGAAPTVSNLTDDASVIANVIANGRIRFGAIMATSLDDANSVGFVKVDGSAPDLVNLVSSNYNIVSNLHGAVPSVSVSAHNTTFGVVVGAGGDMEGDGVAYHNFTGTGVGAAGISARGLLPDVGGEGL